MKVIAEERRTYLRNADLENRVYISIQSHFRFPHKHLDSYMG